MSIPIPEFLHPRDHAGFRQSIGLPAVIWSEENEEYVVEDDVEPLETGVALATIADERGKAERAKILIDSGYRMWRGKSYTDILETSDKKPTEAAIKAIQDGSPEFAEWKQHIADVEATIVFLDVLREAIVNG